MEYPLPTIVEAIEYFCKELGKQGKIIAGVVSRNQERHRVVMTEDAESFYVLFKRDNGFRKWREFYPSLLAIEEEIERVDSMNVPLFYTIKEEYSIKNIILVYADRTIISINKGEWLKRANKYGLYRHINRLQFVNKKDYSGYDDYEDAKVISCYFTKKDIIKEGLKEDGINV